RALESLGVIERDPAGHHFAGHDPAIVGIILMEAERLAARWLPDDIVLADAGARPAAQSRAGLADIAPKHDRGDGEIRFPPVADLPRQVLAIAAEPPVPFIGIKSGLELAGEHRLEACPRL